MMMSPASSSALGSCERTRWVESKVDRVFSGMNVLKEWTKACAAVRLRSIIGGGPREGYAVDRTERGLRESLAKDEDAGRTLKRPKH